MNTAYKVLYCPSGDKLWSYSANVGEPDDYSLVYPPGEFVYALVGELLVFAGKRCAVNFSPRPDYYQVWRVECGALTSRPLLAVLAANIPAFWASVADPSLREVQTFDSPAGTCSTPWLKLMERIKT